MSYQALYRAWRPQTFADLVGQPHVKQTLSNAILRGQVAHAYLFCGPRGTGKTSAAKILAKAVNCRSPKGVEPCNECDACLSITAGNNVDVEEIDAASNRGVDEIRQLRDKVQYAPTNLSRKVYIVDEVHMLTTEAFNALLKTLEEPPGHTLFVLATTEPHKIPATIVSRCQRFDFRRISSEDIYGRLELVCEEKNWTIESEALWKISDAADGGLRDALGLLEQTAAFGQGAITAEHAAHVVGGVQTVALLELVGAIVHRDAGRALSMLMAWYQDGKDPARIIQELLQVLRDLFIVKLTDRASIESRFEAYAGVASSCDTEWLLATVKQLGEAYMHLRFVDQPRLALETAILGVIPPEVSAQQAAAATTVATHTAPVTPSAQSAATVAPAGAQPHRTNATKSADISGDVVGSEAPVGSDVPIGSDAQVGLGAPVGSAVPPPGSSAVSAADSVTSAGSTKAAPQAARSKKSGTPSTSAKRKMEVLADLQRQAEPEVLQQVEAAWPEILQVLKRVRIQTYGSMAYGQAVLATDDVVVLAFGSAVLRDKVMKPEERAAIESAVAEGLGKPLRILALLQADWDAFQEAQAKPADEPDTDDLASKAIALFGKDVVVVRDEE